MSVFSLWVTGKENSDVDIVNDELLLLIGLDNESDFGRLVGADGTTRPTFVCSSTYSLTRDGFQILFEECNHGYGADFEHSNYGGSLITWRIDTNGIIPLDNRCILS
ncbi:hypothetical protein Q1695_016304 [Nippostrongylus brasiliensis]|nr:hypothetical protein Q1695_016304 [Nippostrongylus brasiliensis]